MNASAHVGVRTRVVIVTGLSGAGKSTALKVLEDIGYEAVDNLPLSLLRRLTSAEEGVTEASLRRPLAVGIDARTRDFNSDTFAAKIDRLRAREDAEVSVVFLDADDDVLQSRFTTTRRRHPLAGDRAVADGISIERNLLAPIRARSDLLVDTSRLSQAELRDLLGGHLRLDGATGPQVSVVSFSYRYGLPREADLVFDVRFLANPYYDLRLRPRAGDDPEVGAFIAADPAFEPFFRSVSGMISSLLPLYAREGKRYLTIAIGCTGGRHRSVFVAKRLGDLIEAAGRIVTVRHRDRDRLN